MTGPLPMLELSPIQISILERLSSHGFSVVAFPMYASAVGIRKGNCAVLLAPVHGAGFQPFGEPCWLIEGNLSVRVLRRGRPCFVWKNKQVEMTPAREEELRQFTADLNALLAPAL